jgi:alkyl hydroperoxide reductase subunit AhpC
MKFLVTLLLAISVLAPSAVRAGPWEVGPAVGSRVPALHVTDINGRSVSVHDLSGKNGLVLVFVRSAKWCPYCQKQLGELTEAIGPLGARGYKIAAISYDEPAVLAQFTARRGINYPLLADAGSVTIDSWKLRDSRYQPGSYAWGVPYASIYILTPKGVLRAKLAEEDYKVRPPLSVILSSIDGLPQSR